MNTHFGSSRRLISIPLLIAFAALAAVGTGRRGIYAYRPAFCKILARGTLRRSQRVYLFAISPVKSFSLPQ
jgi:hypothetical protein